MRRDLCRWAATSGLLIAASGVAATPETERLADFDAFCGFVAERYAYFDRKTTDWTAACAASRAAAGAAADRARFVGVVERTLDTLYDAHAHLGTSTPASPRLVPTDTDLFAAWRGADAVLVDVRGASAAWAAGLRPGMRIVAVDDRPIAAAVEGVLPPQPGSPDPAARDWALQRVLAGRQDRRPVRVVTNDGATYAFVPAKERAPGPLSARREDRIGVVVVHNALGDDALVPAFDAALDALGDVDALVLDLRDTPSGGTSSVARGLMSRLVDRERPYQRHERISELRETGTRRIWVEYVAPRGVPFEKPVVVLVGHWTGSMGEGIAIGLNAARGAPVVGAPMAGLVGALDALRLPYAGFEVRVPPSSCRTSTARRESASCRAVSTRRATSSCSRSRCASRTIRDATARAALSGRRQRRRESVATIFSSPAISSGCDVR